MVRRLMICALTLMIVSCYRPVTHTPDANTYYHENYNFIIKTDSVRIVCQQPDELPFDSVVVYRGERVVVADIMVMPRDTLDSVWVKIAHDQATQGWLREIEMLHVVTPDEPVSQLIDIFSNVHLLIILAIACIVVGAFVTHLYRRHKVYPTHVYGVSSLYPTLLTILVAFAAVYYSSIQLYAVESWKFFYYHPTLTPSQLPLHLGIFISCVWLIIILGIACADDALRKLSFTDAMLFLCGLYAMCVVCYLMFSLLTLYYIGYPVFLAFVIFTIYKFRR